MTKIFNEWQLPVKTCCSFSIVIIFFLFLFFFFYWFFFCSSLFLNVKIPCRKWTKRVVRAIKQLWLVNPTTHYGGRKKETTSFEIWLVIKPSLTLLFFCSDNILFSYIFFFSVTWKFIYWLLNQCTSLKLEKGKKKKASYFYALLKKNVFIP